MIRFILLTGLLFIEFSTFAESRIIKLGTGEQIILNDDFTWKFLNKGTGFSSTDVIIKEYEGKLKLANIKYDETKWKEVNPLSPTTEMSFVNTKGDAYVSFIEERIEVPHEAIKNQIIANLKKNGGDGTISSEEFRIVNGIKVAILKVEGQVNKIPVAFLFEVWSSERGTVQVVAFTSKNLFEEYLEDFRNILNGIQIIE